MINRLRNIAYNVLVLQVSEYANFSAQLFLLARLHLPPHDFLSTQEHSISMTSYATYLAETTLPNEVEDFIGVFWI